MANEELTDLLDRFASEIDDHIDADPPVVVVVGEADPGPEAPHIGVEGAKRRRDVVGLLEMGQEAAQEFQEEESPPAPRP
jgi:hypothetical protein